MTLLQRDVLQNIQSEHYDSHITKSTAFFTFWVALKKLLMFWMDLVSNYVQYYDACCSQGATRSLSYIFRIVNSNSDDYSKQPVIINTLHL